MLNPLPKQGLFLSCPAYEVLFGGSAGSGKSLVLVMGAVGTAECGIFNNPRWRGLIVRRTFPELERTLIDVVKREFYGMGKYDGVKHRFVSPCGGLLDFGHIKNDDSVNRYLSMEYNYIGFDELTQFTERMYLFLMSRNRTSDSQIPCKMRAATNPSGIGHVWVKNRFIESENGVKIPPNKVHTYNVKLPDGKIHSTTRAFIPAKIYDNIHLIKNNPNYLAQLMQLPEIERKAYLEGDWDIFSGQFFPEFGEDHIVEPFEIEQGWPIYISMDWGYRTKCAILFFAVDPITDITYLFDEIYVSKMNPDEVSHLIKIKLGKHINNVVGRFTDKRVLVGDDLVGISTRERFANNGLYFMIANDDRIEGWHRTRELLTQDMDGVCYFRVFRSCDNFIRTIPLMIFDGSNENHQEDMYRRAETHCADSLRYFAIMRKTAIHKDEGYMPISANSVTGYLCQNEDQDALRNRVKRLPLLKRGVNYFLDHFPKEEEDVFRGVS